MASAKGNGLTWRVIFDEAGTGAHNMARDHALAMSARRGEGVLRLYSWSAKTVSFGRHEPANELYDKSAADAAGIAFVRRPTGGRAVLHDAELTYGLVLPDRTYRGPKGVYTKIHEGLAHGLAQLGVEAEVAAGGVVLTPDAGPCFQVPAPGEVVVGGQKLVGSAQVRIGNALLQHGSIILDGDQSDLNQLNSTADPVPAPATLRALVGEVSTWDLAEAITGGLRGVLGGQWQEGEYRSGELEEAAWLESERYGNDEWTWRQ
jgi:lipoate-protein ligase A